MEPEKSISLIEILKGFEAAGIRYLLIGGQAVAQYGSPLLTKDVDFWLPPEEKRKALIFLTMEKKFEAPPEEEWAKPLISLFLDWQKIDLIGAQKLSNMEGRVLDFEVCFKRASVLPDLKESFSVRLPSIDDLIALKKMRNPTSKDLEDIRFLESLKREN